MMNDAFATLVSRTRAWFERGHAAGWLSDSDLKRFLSLEQRRPGDLFAADESRAPEAAVEEGARPLVVAFFGGTGVGKSSLLNRLAGEPIARTGVERPTSREVTIYLHESVTLADLPPELPVEHVRVCRHRDDGRRGILWIDAPDIDSTYEANRQLALAWLPHVDLLVYVVSPERYRDDVGWRVLRQRGHKHGWMFAMNRWDEGDVSQKDDFSRMLRDAGLSDPLLLCTCCAPGVVAGHEFGPVAHAPGRQPAGEPPAATTDLGSRSANRGELGSGRRHGRRAISDTPISLPAPDEFDQIEAAINALLAEHGVLELERLGHRARLLEMRDVLNAARRRLGDGKQWKTIQSAHEQHWARGAATILEGLEWPIRAAAGRFAIRERGLLSQVVGQAVVAATGGAGQKPDTGASPVPHAPAAPPSRPGHRADSGDLPVRHADSLDPTTDELTRRIWDEWTQNKLAECLDALELDVRRVGVAAAPLRALLDDAAGDAGRIVSQSVQQELRTALARPGTAVQRAFRRVTGFLMTALPLFALIWVAYNVWRGYVAASSGDAAYLGTDFAVHSALLVVVAWAVPFVCDRLLRPSLERVALRAMRGGLESGLDELGARLREAVAEGAKLAAACDADAAGLIGEISSLALRPVAAAKAPLSRLLVGRVQSAK